MAADAGRRRHRANHRFRSGAVQALAGSGCRALVAGGQGARIENRVALHSMAPRCPSGADLRREFDAARTLEQETRRIGHGRWTPRAADSRTLTLLDQLPCLTSTPAGCPFRTLIPPRALDSNARSKACTVVTAMRRH